MSLCGPFQITKAYLGLGEMFIIRHRNTLVLVQGKTKLITLDNCVRNVFYILSKLQASPSVSLDYSGEAGLFSKGWAQLHIKEILCLWFTLHSQQWVGLGDTVD